MSVEEQIQHSILIVSEDKKILSFIKRSFQNASILSAEYTDNASEARRRILERYYTIVVINASLSGETGSDLAIYTARQCSASVLLIVPAGIYEETMELVTDFGILVLDKPLSIQKLNRAMRFLSSIQSRMKTLEQKAQNAEEKVQEIRLIDKAKFLLVEQRHMTEDEAHRYIGKNAMDHGVSRKRIAQQIIDEE